MRLRHPDGIPALAIDRTFGPAHRNGFTGQVLPMSRIREFLVIPQCLVNSEEAACHRPVPSPASVTDQAGTR